MINFHVGVLTVALLGTLAAPAAAGDKKTMIVALRGTATGQMRPVPMTPQGSTMANCFDVQMVDLEKNRVIGMGTDCLSDVIPEGAGVSLTGTAIFRFNEGTLVTRGRTTVQPISATAMPSPSTHITGAIPVPGTNQVLSGTGKFQGKTGNVRLSGAVNMSQLADSNRITFDCVFVIDLE